MAPKLPRIDASRLARLAGAGRRPRWQVLVAAAVLAVLVPVPAADAATKPVRLTVTGLSIRSGGTWGGDLVTVRGTGFATRRGRAVTAVQFGTFVADGFQVLDDNRIQAFTPQVPNRQTVTDVRVVASNRTATPRTPADVFTFVVPTLDTPINGHWSANQSRAIGDAMMGRAPALQAAPVAPSPGYWTPAMGRSALQRAAGWLGMPYAWAGGNSTGPTFGSCYGDGAINLDCAFRGFDCSGLTLYAWSKYEHLAHFAATQFGQAGSFHPTLGELQPGDLMFFSGGGSVISHVVMYAGNGQVIQASESGWPVRYSSLANVMASHPRYFGATRPMSRGVQAPAAVVTSLSVTRSSVRGGARIIIRGAIFDTASQVSFGGTSTYHFVVHSGNIITATVPAHPSGPVTVRVYNAWGESAVNRHAVLTYFGSPTLRTTSLPSSGLAGGADVLLTGTNFSPDARVYLGTAPVRAVRVLSDKHIRVVLPPHAAGAVAVRVRTPYGLSNPLRVTYLAPAPISVPTPTPTPTG